MTQDIAASCGALPLGVSCTPNPAVLNPGTGYQSVVTLSTDFGTALPAKLTGVNDRDQAGFLRGAQIGVPRAELPPRDDKDFYRADLIGCEVVNLEGRYLGKVRHFVETPAQVLMVVRGAAATGEPSGEREYWVPAVPLHLRRVDLQARRVVVDWDDAAG